MPERYHIPVAAAPPRFRVIGQHSVIDWREDCSRCRNCVKNRCVYGIYKTEYKHDRDPSTDLEPLFECHHCLSCVQNCTKGLLSMSENPAFLALGDEYWRPAIIETTWNQAESGKIPVSGAGYRGRFSGPGFDSMWTDMSEIVRPTRDGIHGREYISTAVDIGSKPLRLSFDGEGRLQSAAASVIEIPIPAIFDLSPWWTERDPIAQARIRAAARLGTLVVALPRDAAGASPEERAFVAPLIDARDVRSHAGLLAPARMAELVDGPDVIAGAEAAREANGGLVVAVRMPLTPGSAERIVELHRDGIDVFHVCADTHGRELETESPRFIKDALLEIHGRLVEEGVRDEVTIIASGGIALAEHMAKSIICGADVVAIGTPLVVALGCRVCGADHRNGSCPARIEDVDPAHAAQRMVNLMGAWHSQLIEVLGAMGIREVRRLRGEVGRAMFLEDLEREAFGDLGN